MTLKEIAQVAQKYDIKTARMKKSDVVRSIQRAEGNFDCFETAENYCDQNSCSWREDCLGGNNSKSQAPKVHKLVSAKPKQRKMKAV